ncbi:hypothetical protein WJX72_000552 [[Myrmecia] bisecta]|uniref:Methyltransferase domain-containing protein n=1 Tax=[Myrmecia] bisecta TaxID=41462 RepID=A0AAW1PV45_9CHLO
MSAQSAVKRDRKQLLRESWTQIALPYERDLVPRFLPWTHHTLDAFTGLNLPPHGQVVVPACGPGHELLMLAKALPESVRILGIDLAEGMVEVANQRIEAAGCSERVHAVAGDACSLPTEWQPISGIVSCFGLQQLPEPHRVLTSWVQSLAPGGVLAVCYWPGSVEEAGPWHRMTQLTANKKPLKQDETADWESQIPVLAAAEGADVLVDAIPQYDMKWPNAETFWKVMTEAGPWHARMLHYGQQHMDDLKVEFLRAYPDSSAPLEHAPRARVIIMRRHKKAML